MCEQGSGPKRSNGGCGCGCGCGCDCGCGGSFRRFYSADERRQCLENYREQLQKELVGVDERLAEMKSC